MRKGIILYNKKELYRYLPDLLEEIQKMVLKREPIIFDVGANLGESIESFRSVFPNASIFSFEPNPTSYLNLVSRYELGESKNQIFNIGLSSKPGCALLNIALNSGHSSIHDFVQDSEWLNLKSKLLNTSPNQYVRESKNIELSTVDLVISDLQLDHVDILKIDVQGHEEEVLKGAMYSLKNQAISLVQVEVIHSKLYAKTISIGEIERWLTPYGYKLIAVSRGGSILSTINFQQDLLYASRNILNSFENKSQ